MLKFGMSKTRVSQIFRKPTDRLARLLSVAMVVPMLSIIGLSSAPVAHADTTYSFGKIAMSSSGQTIYALNGNGSIWKSSDTGTTWTALGSAHTGAWSSIATSADGSSIAASNAATGQILISHDGGTTWNSTVPATSYTQWRQIVMSSDGNKIRAIDSQADVNLYQSDDGGQSWSINSTLPTYESNVASNSLGGCPNVTHQQCPIVTLKDVTMSGSGQNIAVYPDVNGSYQSERQLFISQDGGVTWTQTEGCCRDQPQNGDLGSSKSDVNWTIMMGNYDDAPGFGRFDTGSQSWIFTKQSYLDPAQTTQINHDTWSNFAVAADGDQVIFTGHQDDSTNDLYAGSLSQG